MSSNQLHVSIRGMSLVGYVYWSEGHSVVRDRLSANSVMLVLMLMVHMPTFLAFKSTGEKGLSSQTQTQKRAHLMLGNAHVLAVPLAKIWIIS